MPPRPRELPEEMVEEILLRFPPDDPACLFRAALVYKRWCRLISSPRFRRRFREFHRAAPLLGAIYDRELSTQFWPASSFRPRYATDIDCHAAIDTRHGRVLYNAVGYLVVSDPITGPQYMICLPPTPSSCSWTAAFLCAAPGCDHLDCPSGGPFTIVHVSTEEFSREATWVNVFSSEARTWSEAMTSVGHPRTTAPTIGSTLIGNVIYFVFGSGNRILEYDLGRRVPAVITLPFVRNGIALMTAEDGGLGYCTMEDFKLYMLSREPGLNGWAQRRVVDIRSLLPVSSLSATRTVVAFADGADVIFTYDAYDGTIFAIYLKLGRVTNVDTSIDIFGILPYRNFYTPALDAALR